MNNGSVLLALLVVIAASVWLGMAAQRAVRGKAFLTSYFLGNRGLGAWALALTATVQSGGTFMGYPSLAYRFGWITALWIAGYMVVPLTSFAILGKRLAQLSRRCNAITVPDLLRARFHSEAVGLCASLLIILFMGFMMIAQFKAGALVMKLAWPGSGALAITENVAPGELGTRYYVGLAVFSVTVVGYTLIGGFLASVWTDLFQSILMFFGVILLWCLVVPMAGGTEAATLKAIELTDITYATGPGFDPGGRAFLSVGLAISFFFNWPFAGVGSPAGMVRIMAAKRTDVMRKSIVLLSFYNLAIYIPLIMICVAGRTLIPDLKQTDEIIPRLAIMSTADIPGGTFLSGLILAAPFGAVMATVSCYLIVIASGLVRDIYQRFLRPNAGTRELKHVTFAVMIMIGAVAVILNIRPVTYLQAIVVLSGTSTAAAFVVTALMAAFWRRATKAGALASMICGGGTVMGLYLVGFLHQWVLKGIAGGTPSSLQTSLGRLLGPDPMIGLDDPLRPYYLGGVDPLLWGLLVSLILGVGVSLFTKPPPDEVISLCFDAQADAT